MNKNAELRHRGTESKCQILLWSDTTAIHLMDPQLSRFENLKVFATGQFIRQGIKDEWIQCILEKECSRVVSTCKRASLRKNPDISCSGMCLFSKVVYWFCLVSSDLPIEADKPRVTFRFPLNDWPRDTLKASQDLCPSTSFPPKRGHG